MLYEDRMKEEVLNTLTDKVFNTISNIQSVSEEGFVPSDKKMCLLSLSLILIDAYENINLFDRNQQDSFDNIYNTITIQ